MNNDLNSSENKFAQSLCEFIPNIMFTCGNLENFDSKLTQLDNELSL